MSIKDNDTTCLAARRVLIIASDAAEASVLSNRLKNCGLQEVTGTLESLRAHSDNRDFQADIIVAKVTHGQEMESYYLGSAAARRGIPILFVTIDAKVLAIGSLMHAVPGSVLVEQISSDDIFLEKVEEALARYGSKSD